MSKSQAKTTEKSNVTAVQVPGESSAPDTTEDQTADNAGVAQNTETIPAATVDAEAAAIAQAEADELRQQVAQLQAENAVLSKQSPQVKQAVASRSDYLNMRAGEVDPKTLTKAVLTKDGWVCPPALKQLAKE